MVYILFDKMKLLINLKNFAETKEITEHIFTLLY